MLLLPELLVKHKTWCTVHVRKALIRQGGYGCKVVICHKLCVLNLQLSQEAPTRAQGVLQRGEQQSWVSSNLNNRQCHLLPRVVPPLQPVLLEDIVIH